MLVHATRIEETGGFRIRDFGITCGSSMEDRRRGRIRRISNQWVKGSTPRDILRGIMMKLLYIAFFFVLIDLFLCCNMCLNDKFRTLA